MRRRSNVVEGGKVLYKVEDCNTVSNWRKKTGALRIEKKVASTIYCP